MSKIRTLSKILKNDPKKIIKILGGKGFFNWMPDKLYLKIVYWGETGKKLNLEDPKTYNEKLQWIKLYDRKQEYSTYVDKYEVRKYIAKTIGEEYLIPIIGVYELPNQFVLKCTHGSGSNIICHDKNKLDINNAKKKLNKWMKKNWYWFGREWPYKNVKPRIICEKYISEGTEIPDDYKIMCFNGEPKCIQLHKGRFTNHLQDFYTTDWKLMKLNQGLPSTNGLQERPSKLDEMLDLSRTLSKGFKHIRVDFYYVNKKLYFGELTFFDGSGFYPFEPEEYDYLLGGWINLKENEIINRSTGEQR